MKKKTIIVLAVLLFLLISIGVAYAARQVCDTCNGAGKLCDTCNEPVPGGTIGYYHYSYGGGCRGKVIDCYICDGKRYVEADVCE